MFLGKIRNHLDIYSYFHLDTFCFGINETI